MSEEKEIFAVKKLKSKLGKVLPFVIQMSEVVVEMKCLPYCLIGAALPHKRTKKVQTVFATVSNDEATLEIVLNCCAALLIEKGYKIEKPNDNN